MGENTRIRGAPSNVVGVLDLNGVGFGERPANLSGDGFRRKVGGRDI